MNLDKRQKILVGALAGVLLLWQGGGVVWKVVFGPISDRYATIAELDGKLKSQEDAKHKLDLAERQLKIAERRSLPPNPTVASNSYHFWILDLAAERHKFDRSKLIVSPKKVNVSLGSTNGVYTRIPISMTAECKMDQLCRFLYDFYCADLMHKVTRLSIESQDFKADPTLKVNLEIEGLALTSAKNRNKLFADKQDKVVSDMMSKKALDDYKSLIDQNQFVRGYNGPPAPPAPPGPPPKPFDSAPYTRLVGVSETVGEPPVAYLYDATANKQQLLTPGQEFEIAGIKGKVLEIAVIPRYVTMRVKDKDWRLDVGDSLKELIELKPAETAPATNPTTAPVISTPVNAAPASPPA